MSGEVVHKLINENITFQYMDGDENSLWSLLLVLGLIVSLKDQYRIVSNRESGRGRYDIALYLVHEDTDAFIMEFKVLDERREKSLEETAQNELSQIEDRQYEADLLAAGIPKERIYKLGFAFCNKEVMVVEAHV